MITVSTSESSQRSYHHGDLRAALVDAGLKALETTALEDLSLRQVARAVGVSATAVYRHFPDKRALLGALAGEAAERLGQAQQAAAATAPDQATRFAATGRAYVRFALANPSLFRLLYAVKGQDHCAAPSDGPPPPPSGAFGENTAANLLRAFATAFTDGSPEEVMRLQVQAWSVVHGLAMLMLDGQLPPDDALIDRVIDGRTLFNLKTNRQAASPAKP
ncbi:TetR/AcrR family transcriptional regulator [Zavarzinia sp. CC-PAN008]|uniref:TetR/AcrR family transcriptional regulator n=1 Tax=Zavarzinia sp. CC-PAN008 TaxID=3243332 RepID=UPI003F742904